MKYDEATADSEAQSFEAAVVAGAKGDGKDAEANANGGRAGDSVALPALKNGETTPDMATLIPFNDKPWEFVYFTRFSGTKATSYVAQIHRQRRHAGLCCSPRVSSD